MPIQAENSMELMWKEAAGNIRKNVNLPSGWRTSAAGYFWQFAYHSCCHALFDTIIQLFIVKM
jgi:hypothetical protein